MKILVLGGSGFIGRYVCKELFLKGHEVISYGRRPYAFPRDLGIVCISGDLNDDQAIRKSLCGVNLVVHCIGSSSPSRTQKDPFSDVQGNVLGTIRLLSLCVETGISRVIFLSSGGSVYGNSKKLPLREDNIQRPISFYGVGKLAIEHYLLSFNHEHGMNNIILRVSNPYGPGQTHDRQQGIVSIFARKILSSRSVDVWGDGSATRDYLYVKDVASAVVKSLDYFGEYSTFNISSCEERSVLDVIREIESNLEVEAKLNFCPDRAFNVKRNVLDNSLAKRELGWHPKVNWKSGIRLTINSLTSKLVSISQ